MSLSATIQEQLSTIGNLDLATLAFGMIALGLVLGTCLIPRRRLTGGPKFPPLPEVTAREADARARQGNDRRSALRRADKPTPLLVNDPEMMDEPAPGWVLDRSTGGLGIMLAGPLAPDTVVNVRSADAPADSPWVPLRIRHCRPVEGGFQVGGQFMKPLPWHVLLLFG